jgi:hypothetical protein
MIGILTFILAVSTFAEKSNGDHHLPERNGRITLAAIAFLGLTTLVLRGIPVVPGCSGTEEYQPHDTREQHRMHGAS